MMAHSLSSEELARLPACAAIAAAKGLDERYLGDCAIRAFQGRHIVDICEALGLACDISTELVIQGGIGTLIMRWGGNQRTLAPSLLQQAAGAIATAAATAGRALTGRPVTVDAETRDRRLAACQACPLWRAAEDRCGACGCITRAKAALAASRCPEGRWP